MLWWRGIPQEANAQGNAWDRLTWGCYTRRHRNSGRVWALGERDSLSRIESRTHCPTQENVCQVP